MEEEKIKSHFFNETTLEKKNNAFWRAAYNKTNYDKMLKCIKLASTLPNQSVNELIENSKKIYQFLNNQ